MDVLYGDWNPSGRLPYTIAKSASDYSAHIIIEGSWTTVTPIPYTEGSVHLAQRILLAEDCVSALASRLTIATLMQYVSLLPRLQPVDETN